MFNRQYFCSAFFFLFATLSLTAIVGCSSIPTQEAMFAPAPADTAASADATVAPAQDMLTPEISTAPEAAAPLVILGPAPPVQDLGRISDEPFAARRHLGPTCVRSSRIS